MCTRASAAPALSAAPPAPGRPHCMRGLCPTAPGRSVRARRRRAPPPGGAGRQAALAPSSPQARLLARPPARRCVRAALLFARRGAPAPAPGPDRRGAVLRAALFASQGAPAPAPGSACAWVPSFRPYGDCGLPLPPRRAEGLPRGRGRLECLSLFGWIRCVLHPVRLNGRLRAAESRDGAKDFTVRAPPLVAATRDCPQSVGKRGRGAPVRRARTAPAVTCRVRMRGGWDLGWAGQPQ